MGKAKELAELGDKLTVSGGAVTVSGFNYDNIVDSAPGALDTLNELAAAIGDDANFSTTVTNSIATKMPLAGGNFTGSVGIGTANPAKKLHIRDSIPDIRLEDTDTNAVVDLKANTGTGSFVIATDVNNAVADSKIVFQVDNDEKVRIDNNGRVGIGTSGPEYPLHVVGSNVSSGGGLATLGIYDSGTAYNGTNPGGGITFRGKFNSSNSFTNFATVQGIKENTTDGNYATALRFTTRANGGNLTEKMRIDSSGTVLVGRTADGDGTVGAMIRGTGFIQSTRDGSLAADFNRLSSDGDIIRFQKASSPVGTIGYESSGLYVDGEASHAGLKLFASSVAPRQNGADVDATIDLGWTGGKFKDIYASGTVYATPGGNDGSSANYAANSANEILNNYGYKPSGLYWIREPNTGTPKQIYCDNIF